MVLNIHCFCKSSLLITWARFLVQCEMLSSCIRCVMPCVSGVVSSGLLRIGRNLPWPGVGVHGEAKSTCWGCCVSASTLSDSLSCFFHSGN